MNAPGDRFDKANPDEGWCEKCGFRYSEHILHPLKEQLNRFRTTTKPDESVDGVITDPLARVQEDI